MERCKDEKKYKNIDIEIINLLKFIDRNLSL